MATPPGQRTFMCGRDFFPSPPSDVAALFIASAAAMASILTDGYPRSALSAMSRTDVPGDSGGGRPR